jgi:cytoskeleton protein RodZ
MPVDRTLDDFGSTLRQARERRGMSLKQIANATKISVAALEGLERNDITHLPGGIFSRAFVRSYAVEVGLDADKTIQHFIASFPNEATVAAHAAAGRIEDNQAIESERRTARTFLRLILVSVPAAALVLYFAAVGRRTSTPPETSPIAEREPVAAPLTTTTPTQTPPAPTADRPAQDPPPAAPTAPVAAAATGGNPAVDRLLVGLMVKRAVWVSAIVDGQKTIERLLQPGEQRTIEVRRELVLTAGDASAVALTLNGADARPLGKAGEVVTSRLDLANFKDYLSSR